MTHALETDKALQPPPLHMARTFPVPRETLFRAWSSAEHVARWFTPAMLTTPHAHVDMRVGGAFEVCMRMPNGIEHWTRGTFVVVDANERLVLDLRAEDAQGRVLFHAHTDVRFSDTPGGAHLEVVQTYRVIDPAAGAMIGGAAAGWTSTLENLAAEAGRMLAAGEVTRSVVHASFRLERVYDATPAQVFAAFADGEAKRQWFQGPPEWGMRDREFDFRIGGREAHRTGPKGGAAHAFEARYWDIVPNARIVYSYDMHLDDFRISVSLTTIEMKPAGPGTRLVFTEQGAFLDGYDGADAREEGSMSLLDNLGRYLDGKA